MSNTELRECSGSHRVPGRELNEFPLAYHLCVKANSPRFSWSSPSLAKRRSEFSLPKHTLETVFRPFPIKVTVLLPTAS